MKILYYSPHPTINYSAPSGPGTHIRSVVKAFEQHGNFVLRFISGGESLTGGTDIKYKSRWIKKLIPSVIWQTLKDYQLIRLDRANARMLEKLILEEKPDLVYERSYYLMRSGYQTAKKLGVKYFCEINAPYPEEKLDMEGRSLFVKRSRKTEIEQILCADAVFTVSSAMKEYLTKNANCNPEKVVVTPNAVDLDSMLIDEEKVSVIREKYKIEKSDYVIGFVGSIFPYHGVDVLLETFHKWIVGKPGSYKLLIVGDGEVLPTLKEYALKNFSEGKVIFTGNVPHNDVYNYISLMNIAVMARSNWYGSPVKIFEYGALGKAIIAPDTVPVRDVMIDRVDGLLIKDNENELMRAINFLVSNPDKAEKMANSFREKVCEKHTWYKVGEKILNQVK